MMNTSSKIAAALVGAGLLLSGGVAGATGLGSAGPMGGNGKGVGHGPPGVEAVPGDGQVALAWKTPVLS